MNGQSKDSNDLKQAGLPSDFNVGFFNAEGSADVTGEKKLTTHQGTQQRPTTSINGTELESLEPLPVRKSLIEKGSLTGRAGPLEEDLKHPGEIVSKRFSAVFSQHLEKESVGVSKIDLDLLKKATASININISKLLKKESEERKEETFTKDFGCTEPLTNKDEKMKASQKQSLFKQESTIDTVEALKLIASAETSLSPASSENSNNKDASSTLRTQSKNSSALSEVQNPLEEKVEKSCLGELEGCQRDQELHDEQQTSKKLISILNVKSQNLSSDERSPTMRAIAEQGALVSIEGKSATEIEQLFQLRPFEIRIPNMTEEEIFRYKSGESFAVISQEGEETESQINEDEKISGRVDTHSSSVNKGENSLSPSLSGADISQYDKTVRSDLPTVEDAAKAPIKVNEASGLTSTRKEIRRSSPSRGCSVCARKLTDCVGDWLESLGPQSIYCSRKCIEKQVELAKEAVTSDTCKIMVLERSGTMLCGPAAPTSGTLLEFLISHPEFTPVLPTAKEPHSDNPQSASIKNNKQSESEIRTDKILSKETDQKRFQVRRAIAETLIERAKKTPDFVFTKTEVKNLAQKIEERLFKECKQSIDGRYRAWFKQFITNVTAKSNKGFYLRVVLGEISVQKLVSLDAHSLSASCFSEPVVIPDSRKSVKSSNGEKPKFDKGSELDVAPMKKKPKVEEKRKNVVSPSLIAKANMCSIQKKKIAKEPPSEIDKILGVEPRNTTDSHKHHLYDLNCDICTGKKERDSQKRKRQLAEKEHGTIRKKNTYGSEGLALLRAQSEITNDKTGSGSTTVTDDMCQTCSSSDRGKVKTKSMGEESSWRNSTSIIGHDENEVKEESWRQPWKPDETGFGDSWRKDRKDKLEDSCLQDSFITWENTSGGKWGNSKRSFGDVERRRHKSWREEKREDRRKDIEPIDLLAEEEERPLTMWEREERHIVWTGILLMRQYFKFPATLTALSNEKAFCLRKELPPVLQIIGRIPPSIVFDYIAQLRKTHAKDVIVLRLDRPVNREMDEQFMKCFNDMEKKGKYSVLQLSQQKMLKDGYLIALRSGKKAPAVLLPYDGPGIPDDHGDIIICVIVRYKDSALSETLISTSRKAKKENSDRLSFTDVTQKSVVEIPLEPTYGASSPGTCMREFEASLETQGSIFHPDISPKAGELQDFAPLYESPGKHVNLSTESVHESTTRTRLSGREDESTEARDEGSQLSHRSSQLISEKQFFEDSKPLISSVSELIVAIKTYPQLVEISQLVEEFIKNNSLQPEDEELIKKALEQKVRIEKDRRSKIVGDDNSKLNIEESQDSSVNTRSDDGIEKLDSSVGSEELMKSDELARRSGIGKTSALSSPPKSMFSFNSLPLVPAKIDLNTCAPPPPPQPPPPSFPNTFSPSKNSIPLPPPPQPPPDVSTICEPASIEESSEVIQLATTQFADILTSLEKVSSAPSITLFSDPVPSQFGTIESRVNEGEMDMDISDDDDDEDEADSKVASPLKRNLGVKLRPPSAAKFSVPSPQPPPTIKLLAPPVPPPVVPVPTVKIPEVSKGSSFQAADMIPTAASSSPKVQRPGLPSLPIKAGRRHPLLSVSPCGLKPLAARDARFANKQLEPKSAPHPPCGSSKAEKLIAPKKAELISRVPYPFSGDESGLSSSKSCESRRSSLLGAYPHSSICNYNLPASRNDNFFLNRGSIHETRSVEGGPVVDEDWDTGDFLNKQTRYYGEEGPSTSTDFDNFDDGGYARYSQNRNLYTIQGTSRSQQQRLFGGSGISNMVCQQQYGYNDADDSSYWPSREVQTFNIPTPPKPEDEFYDGPVEELYRRNASADFDRSCDDNLFPTKFPVPSKVPHNFLIPQRRQVPSSDSSYVDIYQPIHNEALPKNFGSSIRDTRRRRGRGSFRY